MKTEQETEFRLQLIKALNEKTIYKRCKALKEMGFELTEGKHIILRINEKVFTMSRTPSDPRAYKNLCSVICREVFHEHN